MKSWYCQNNLRKQLQLLTIFATHSIVDVWQSSKYASVSDLEYTRVLNMPWLHRVLNKKNFTTPFYGCSSTAPRLEPLRRGSLLFTTKFPDIPGAHFTSLRRMKDWAELGATQWSGFEQGTPGLGIQHLNHYVWIMS